MKKIKILHFEDSVNDSELIHSLIENEGIEHDYFWAYNEREFLHTLETENIDIILSDYYMPGFNGNEALKVAMKKYSHIPFIFISGAMGKDAADAMLGGATDYVLKDKLELLIPAIKRALRKLELESKPTSTEQELIAENKELVSHNEENEKLMKELINANKELVSQNNKKEKK